MTKGILGLLVSFDFFEEIYPKSLGPNLFDFILLFSTEIAPILILSLSSRFKGGATSYTNDETPMERNSYDSTTSDSVKKGPIEREMNIYQ